MASDLHGERFTCRHRRIHLSGTGTVAYPHQVPKKSTATTFPEEMCCWNSSSLVMVMEGMSCVCVFVEGRRETEAGSVAINQRVNKQLRTNTNEDTHKSNAPSRSSFIIHVAVRETMAVDAAHAKRETEVRQACSKCSCTVELYDTKRCSSRVQLDLGLEFASISANHLFHLLAILEDCRRNAAEYI